MLERNLFRTTCNRLLLGYFFVHLFATCHTKSRFIQFNHGHQNNNGASVHIAANSADPTLEPTTDMTTVRDIVIGPCVWVMGRKCPDNDVKFYLYTRRNIKSGQYIHVDVSMEKSNLTQSFFNPKHPTKIILHGYNSDVFLTPLRRMREEYFSITEYNIIYVDWSVLSPGPCYISAVHNTKHTGACVAQLIERILDYGSTDIHIIGFSLGAQVPNFVAQNLPTFKLPRITALDPAMPLFITASNDNKLDPSDADYVDVLHTNAMVQGKLERCGHADFYMNGGIIQPGCRGKDSNIVACSHQRAPTYFLESIRSRKGFWGWSCSSYIAYLLGMCPPTNFLVEAGEKILRSTKGMYLIETNETAPFALGKWTDLPILGIKNRPLYWRERLNRIILKVPQHRNEPLLRNVDMWGKLDSEFNNLKTNYYTYDSENQLNNDHFNIGDVIDNNFALTIGVNDADEGNDSIEELELSNGDDITITAHSNDGQQYHKPKINWSEYRRNLTSGFIDESVFKLS